MPITQEHWNNAKSFVAAKAQERGKTDGGEIIELFFEFWDTITDEAAVARAFKEEELKRLTTAIPLSEESVAKMKERKAELERDLGGRGRTP